MLTAVCLDTTFLVDLLAGEPRAVAFADALSEPVAVSSVSFYELLYGGVGRRRLSQVETMARDYAVLPADFESSGIACPRAEVRHATTGRRFPSAEGPWDRAGGRSAVPR